MKALLLTEYKHLELTDMPEPEVGPHDVLVRVKSCGICGSDIHGYDGSTGRRVPPLVMGHEAAGQIAAVGSEVSRFAAGDRVTFDSMVSCGRCHFCHQGQPNLCDNRRVLGVSCADYRQHGAFAEFVVVPDHIVFKLPDNLEYHRAAMVEPVSIAVHAVHLAKIRLADTAVVVGTGMIGVLVVQALRAAGCGTIIGVDLADEKLELAKKLGADYTFNPKNGDIAKEVAALTDGRGADVAIECVGAAAPVDTAIAALRKGGTCVLVGNVTPRIDFPLQTVVTREISVLGSCASSNEYPICIDLLSRGLIQVDPLITARAPLGEGPDWFSRLYAGEPGLMKVMLQP